MERRWAPNPRAQEEGSGRSRSGAGWSGRPPPSGRVPATIRSIFSRRGQNRAPARSWPMAPPAIVISSAPPLIARCGPPRPPETAATSGPPFPVPHQRRRPRPCENFPAVCDRPRTAMIASPTSRPLRDRGRRRKLERQGELSAESSSGPLTRQSVRSKSAANKNKAPRSGHVTVVLLRARRSPVAAGRTGTAQRRLARLLKPRQVVQHKIDVSPSARCSDGGAREPVCRRIIPRPTTPRARWRRREARASRSRPPPRIGRPMVGEACSARRALERNKHLRGSVGVGPVRRGVEASDVALVVEAHERSTAAAREGGVRGRYPSCHGYHRVPEPHDQHAGLRVGRVPPELLVAQSVIPPPPLPDSCRNRSSISEDSSEP